MRSMLLVISTLNLWDLTCTLMLMTSVCMFELNPLAAALVRHGPWAIVAYKLALMAITTACFWRARRTLLAWLGSVLCLAVLLTLSTHWVHVLGVPPDAGILGSDTPPIPGAEWVRFR
jgi:hypothetical protein